MELVYIGDLKSPGISHTGSSPVLRTISPVWRLVMISYRDKTFCPFDTCRHFSVCPRACTTEVRMGALIWWGGDDAPISFYAKKPMCFEDAL